MIKPIPKDKLIYVRQLRKKPTIWENKLWEHLKRRNLGFRFKRQVYIGGYLVDLSCHAKKLIVELDGAYHATDSGRLYDQERSRFLKHEGYRIVRIWNSEIDKDINKVLDRIIKALS